jgi:hypothetical protein
MKCNVIYAVYWIEDCTVLATCFLVSLPIRTSISSGNCNRAITGNNIFVTSISLSHARSCAASIGLQSRLSVVQNIMMKQPLSSNDGIPGIGKTRATAILIRMLLEGGKTVVYFIKAPKGEGYYYKFIPGAGKYNPIAVNATTN